jgi:selenocysteine-specific elongation factor
MDVDQPLVIGTAGHIDHGKTSLVRAITGIDTDRLAEEQRRGITIELGFAHATLPSGRHVAVIDVPGHERFVHHMLAGAAGIDLMLLVVAADDGVMEQTREHLEICQLLGCRAGVVAVTKIDLVETEWLAMVQEDLRATVAATFLADAPIVPVSCRTGDGIPDLVAALDTALVTVAPRSATRPLRLPVDRVFQMHGFGTVVTGTVLDGVLATGDKVVLAPGDRTVRVRGVQVHNQAVDQARAGQRAAVNLVGVETQELWRGMTLVHPGGYLPADRLTVELATLERTAPVLKDRQRLRLHLGADALLARLSLLEATHQEPGTTTLAQLQLERPCVALPGDRFVIRSYSPIHTIGGGRVLAVGGTKIHRRGGRGADAVRPLANPDPEVRLFHQIARHGRDGLPADRLAFVTGLDHDSAARHAAALVERGAAIAVGDPPTYFAAALLDDLQARLIALLAEYHRAEPWAEEMPRQELAQRIHLPPGHLLTALLERCPDAVTTAGGARLATHRVELDDEATRLRDAILHALGAQPATPPTVAELAAQLSAQRPTVEALLALLVRGGEVVRVAPDLHYRADALEQIHTALVRHLDIHGEIAVPAFKAQHGLSRKHAIPLLEYFDRIGVTRRAGEARVLVR